METEVPFRQEAETEEDIKGKTAETEKAGEKTEEQTERETERPVLQIYTGEENEEKEDTGEKRKRRGANIDQAGRYGFSSVCRRYLSV